MSDGLDPQYSTWISFLLREIQSQVERDEAEFADLGRNHTRPGQDQEPVLSQIALRGFRSFLGLAEVPLAPLTLLVGPNSAGKSSVLDLLALVCQSGTGDLHAGEGVTPPSSAWTWVYGHDPEGKVGVELRGDRWRAGQIYSAAGDRLVPILTWEADRETGAKRVTDPGGDVDRVALASPSRRSAPDVGAGGIAALVEDSWEEDFQIRISGVESIEAEYSDDPKTLTADKHVEDQYSGSGEILAQFELLRQKSRARTRLKRPVTYLHGAGWLRTDLENLFPDPSRLDEVNRLLRAVVDDRFCLKLDRRQPAEDVGFVPSVGETLRVAVVDQWVSPNIEVGLSEMGSGARRVLPLIAALTGSPGLILLGEPEQNLHPAFQAKLADLLVEAVAGGGPRKQVVAETHSELLIRRVLRRIREGMIDAGQVSVVYVDRDPDQGSFARPLRIDSRGRFRDPWPQGFFEERLGEE